MFYYGNRFYVRFIFKLKISVFDFIHFSNTHRSTECNWRSRESISATKDYRGQKQRSFHQPSQYNERQQYWHNITSQNASSFTTYESEKQEHHGNIHSGISTASIKYVPIIPHEYVQEIHMKNRFISSGR